MITKSEEEYIMEEAIGSKIADYLIKPVNPNQILLVLKKNLDHLDWFLKKQPPTTNRNFERFLWILAMVNTYQNGWNYIKSLLHWEIQLRNYRRSGMFEILERQKDEANTQFCKFIKNNYGLVSWR